MLYQYSAIEAIRQPAASLPEDKPPYPTKTGFYSVVHNLDRSGRTITHLAVCHVATGNRAELTVFENICSGGKTADNPFSYSVGPEYLFDYWYLEGAAVSDSCIFRFRTEYQVFCSVTPGNTNRITLMIEGDRDGRPDHLTIFVGQIKGCTVPLIRV